MPDAISFSHIINPFPAPPESEHGRAARITFASLRNAVQEARRVGVSVEVRAVTLPGDERAIEAPATPTPHLSRTVQDVRKLQPVRPLPLIADILQKGATAAAGDYLVFSNMDIAVQPDFYPSLEQLIITRFCPNTPFVVFRRNISAEFTKVDQLPQMYVAHGDVAVGFDCFVFPQKYLAELDLGYTCIGSGHFDNLLYMALDAASGFRMRQVANPRLTFHIGNGIDWTRHIDYIEHNLRESLGAIARIRARYQIPADSAFAKMEKNHFLPNARIDSTLMRKLKRLPGVGAAVHRMKQLMGRNY
jgi:hypothetical protein